MIEAYSSIELRKKIPEQEHRASPVCWWITPVKSPLCTSRLGSSSRESRSSNLTQVCGARRRASRLVLRVQRLKPNRPTSSSYNRTTYSYQPQLTKAANIVYLSSFSPSPASAASPQITTARSCRSTCSHSTVSTSESTQEGTGCPCTRRRSMAT